MLIPENSEKESTFRSAASQTPGTAGRVHAFTDNRPETLAQQQRQSMADNSVQVKKAAQLKAMLETTGRYGHPAAGGHVAQLFLLKNYTDYDGFLASDPGITPDKVRDMVKILKKGEELPTDDFTYQNVRLMQRNGPISKDWDEYDSGQDKKQDSVVRKVISNGHHRFTAFVEAGINPKNYISKGGETPVFAYSWYELGGIDEDL